MSVTRYHCAHAWLPTGVADDVLVMYAKVYKTTAQEHYWSQDGPGGGGEPAEGFASPVDSNGNVIK